MDGEFEQSRSVPLHACLCWQTRWSQHLFCKWAVVCGGGFYSTLYLSGSVSFLSVLVYSFNSDWYRWKKWFCCLCDYFNLLWVTRLAPKSTDVVTLFLELFAGVGAGSLEGARARDRGATTLRSTAATKREEERQSTGRLAVAALWCCATCLH